MISAIGGVGGIGKTWLALAWAHHNLDRFPDGQMFVDLHGFSPAGRPTEPADAMRGFLEALGVDSDHLPADLDAQASLYRGLVSGRRMLIVLDNAATTSQILPLLPGSPTCTVLVTGRTTLSSLIDRYGARHLPLDVLNHEEARNLLARRLGQQRIDAEPDATDEIVRLCGRHPLALAITARHAATRSTIPLAEFAAELRDLGLEMLDHDTDPTANLPAVLSWSLRILTEQQQMVFALLGIAPGPDTDLPAAASLVGLSWTQTRKALRALENSSLLDRHPLGRYTMHDLVRAYAAATARQGLARDLRVAALGRVVDYYLHTAHNAHALVAPFIQPLRLATLAPGIQLQPLSDMADALAWLDTQHTNLLAAQHTAAVHHWYQSVWQLAWALEALHRRTGQFYDALAVWQAAADTLAHLPDPTAHIQVHCHLGNIYSKLGQHDTGAKHLRRALALAEEHYDTAEQAHIHHYLAWTWERRGDYRQALRHIMRAWSLYRSLDLPVRAAAAINLLGRYTAHLGEYDTARNHCESALTIHRRHGNRSGEAAALRNLGFINDHSGNPEQAIAHYRQALAVFDVLGDIDSIADTLDDLGHPSTALGHYEEARNA